MKTLTRYKLRTFATIILPIVMIGFFLGALTACAWLKTTAKEAASAIIDCTTREALDARDAFAPLVEDAIISATNDHGGVDFDPVKSLASRFKTNVQRCVFASAIATLSKLKPRDPDAPQSEALHPDPSALRGGFEKIRAELYGGARFKTVDGEI